jgi:hypothetical protein
MTAPPDRDRQPPDQPLAPPLTAAALNGHAAGSPPGTRIQRSFETDGRRPVPFGNSPVNDTGQSHRAKGGGLLAAASCLLLLLAAAQGYVSFRAQYAFVDHAKHTRIPSVLEALGLDTGAVIFALLALSLARRGRRGTVERVLNVACALGSLAMNLLAANLTSPRSITVWVLPSALYALASDRLIAVVRRWVQASDPATQTGPEGSAWRAVGGLALWALRLIFDVRGTLAGFRRWVLAVAPVAPGVRAVTRPAASMRPALAGGDGNETDDGQAHGAEPGLASPRVQPGPPAQAGSPLHDAAAHQRRAPGETKRAALIRLYERSGESGDARYGDRAKSAALASEIAGRIGYHPGTARRELARYLATNPSPGSRPLPETQPAPAAEEVA